jgi:hypothetical protein
MHIASACIFTLMVASNSPILAQSASLPDPRQLMREVVEHQKQLDEVRENYTYSSFSKTEDLDGKAQVVKTRTEERENFYVNGHLIARTVKKDSKPLEEHEEEKERERVLKLVDLAQKTPKDQTLDGQAVTIARLLDIMQAGNERREQFRGRSAIVLDFAGNPNAKTHGMAEDMSKKLKGTIWIDELDREVSHIEVSFYEDFRIGGGLVGSISKGSHFSFDQGKVNGELWLPTAATADFKARVLLLKSINQRFSEFDSGYQRFRVETAQPKDARLITQP